MDTLTVAVLVLLAIGGGASAWLLGVRHPRERQATGLHALASMHWRELQRLVVAAMQAHGYRPRATASAGDDAGLVELERDGRTWLLSTKHGIAYVPGAVAIDEFANTIRLRGVAGGWMATLGTPASGIASLAYAQKVELIDGARLWADVEPLLDAEQRRALLGTVQQRTVRHVAMAWGLALLAAGTAYLLLAQRTPTTVVAGTAATTLPGVSVAPAASAPPTSKTPPTTNDLNHGPVPTNPAALNARRNQLALAVGTLPWVHRAIWSTQSTLLVNLQPDASVNREALCKLVEAYPELRASRLQLQPPRDGDQPVRFLQCRSY